MNQRYESTGLVYALPTTTKVLMTMLVLPVSKVQYCATVGLPLTKGVVLIEKHLLQTSGYSLKSMTFLL